MDFLLFFIFFVLFCILVYKNLVDYYRSSYYKVTHTPLLSLFFNVGKQGEYRIYQLLRSLENSTTKFLFNLYIPRYGNKTTEIDVIIITMQGIFVFESKNYSGWIFGTDSQRYWTQTLPSYYNHCLKNHFYNPIQQNKTHIKYLKRIIKMEKLKYYSFIVFSNYCEIKKLENNTDTRVIYFNQLLSNVQTDMANSNILTSTQVNEIYNLLYKYTQVDENTRKKHIKDITLISK